MQREIKRELVFSTGEQKENEFLAQKNRERIGRERGENGSY